MNNLFNKQMLVSAAMGGLIVLALAVVMGADSSTNSNTTINTNIRYQTTAVGSESFVITDGSSGKSVVYTLRPVGSDKPVLVRATLNP